MYLRNVLTFSLEETFSATPSTPHLPHSYLLLSCPPLEFETGVWPSFWECLPAPGKRLHNAQMVKFTHQKLKRDMCVFSRAIITVTPPSKVASPTRQLYEMPRPDFPRVVVK